MVQQHCHQHAVLRYADEQHVLESGGVDVDVLDAGCCGLAGNFGFERGHYDVSVACAEDKMLPAIRDRDPETLVLADGFSCRLQIRELTDECDPGILRRSSPPLSATEPAPPTITPLPRKRSGPGEVRGRL